MHFSGRPANFTAFVLVAIVAVNNQQLGPSTNRQPNGYMKGYRIATDSVLCMTYCSNYIHSLTHKVSKVTSSIKIILPLTHSCKSVFQLILLYSDSKK